MCSMCSLTSPHLTSPHSERDGPAVLKVFSHQQKRLFQHNPPIAVILPRLAFDPLRKPRHSLVAHPAAPSFDREQQRERNSQ
jgi:hypothetical protein